MTESYSKNTWRSSTRLLPADAGKTLTGEQQITEIVNKFVTQVGSYLQQIFDNDQIAFTHSIQESKGDVDKFSYEISLLDQIHRFQIENFPEALYDDKRHIYVFIDIVQ
ncbi:MAG: hypothetical protein ACXVPK_11535, partial [Tumebacillaceae bacterium]